MPWWRLGRTASRSSFGGGGVRGRGAAGGTFGWVGAVGMNGAVGIGMSYRWVVLGRL